MGKLRRIALAPATRAAVGGLLIVTGAPPFPSTTIAGAFLGVVLFASSLISMPETLSARAASAIGARRGLLFGLMANVVAMSFIPATITRFTDLPAVAAYLALFLLALAQGATFAIAGAVVAALRKWPFPLIFAIGFGLAMALPTLFPWTIAAPLGRAPVFLQFADVLGEKGVAVLLAAIAAMTARSFVQSGRARLRSQLAVVATLALMIGYGLLRIAMVDRIRSSAPHRVIALVQQAVPPKERWQSERAPAIVHKLWSLTRIAQAQGAEIAIWPEAAYPYVLPHAQGREFGPYPIRGPGITIEVVTGLLTDAPRPLGAEPTSHWSYNATALVDGNDHVAQPTAKIELLAFGEAVPLGDRIPALQRMFARGGGLIAGSAPVLLVTPSQPAARMGVLNCYEDTIGSVGRKVMATGPNLLVNVTNDAWFGATAEPELHLLESISRAIESRRDLVRAVNTGVTAHIDAAGRVLARAEREVPTVLIVEPRLLESAPTVYVRFGDATWMLGLAVSALIAWVNTWTLVRASRTSAAAKR